MKISKLVLMITLLLAVMLFATSVFAATPAPTRTVISIPTPTPTRTVISIPTPTKTVPTTPKPMYRINVHQTNNSGAPANDLEIFIKGNVQILDWWHDLNFCPFQNMTYWYDPVTNTTIVRFYNGIAYPGQEVNCCIFLNQPIFEYQLRQWSVDGKPVAPVGAALSVDFKQTVPGMADIIIANTPQDGGDVTISILQIGAAKRDFSFAELTWANPVLDQEIIWTVTLKDIRLPKNGSITIPSIPMPFPATGLVYRLKVSLDPAAPIAGGATMAGETANGIIDYVAQFTTVSQPH